MKPILFLALSSTFFISPSIFASGDKVGGGGAVVVCKNTSNGQITSVKLLDLYQAEIERGFSVPRSTTSKEAQIENALKSLDPQLAYDIQRRIAKIKADFLPPNIVMHQKYDLGEKPVQIEDNCSPEWVAYYGEDHRLKIVSKYYNRMSVTDQAALFVHEGIYKIARDYDGEMDSARTRQVVGVLFSSQPNPYEIKSLTQSLIRTEIRETFVCENQLEATLIKPMSASGAYSLEYLVRMDGNEDWASSQILATYRAPLAQTGNRLEGSLQAVVSCRRDSKSISTTENTFVEFNSQNDTILLRMPLLTGQYWIKPTQDGLFKWIDPQWETFAWVSADIVRCQPKPYVRPEVTKPRQPFLLSL